METTATDDVDDSGERERQTVVVRERLIGRKRGKSNGGL